jgi:hypothetical protein
MSLQASEEEAPMTTQTKMTITDAADLANAIKAIDLTGDSDTNTNYTFTFDLSGGKGCR